MNDRLQKLGSLLHFLLSNVADHGKVVCMFGPSIERFLGHFEVWVPACIHAPIRIPIHETLFGCQLSDMDRDFLAKAITAFLQTHGYAIIKGDRLDVVQLWTKTLSLVLNEKERVLTLIPTQIGTTYIPDLRSVSACLFDKDVLQSQM